MVAPENYGLPEVPEVPSVPIFPSKEIDRFPYRLMRGKAESSEVSPTEEHDRLELSSEAKAFHAARVLFDDIVSSLGQRLREAHPPIELVLPDTSRVDESLRQRDELPPLATAEWMRFELQRLARESFSRVEAVRTESFEAFKSAAREAVREAAARAGERLMTEDQLDEPTRDRLEAIAQDVLDGVATLTPR